MNSSSTGTITIRKDLLFNGMKIFSATMMNDREHLGEKVTAWIRDNPQAKLTDITVTQSSDEAFHCIAITVCFHEQLNR